MKSDAGRKQSGVDAVSSSTGTFHIPTLPVCDITEDVM